jgi:hypothetical protein
MKSRHVGPGGAGVTWFVRGWRFRLESRRNDPTARDMYVWPPEALSERGRVVKQELCRVRSMKEMGRLLLGRVANLSGGWRPPAHGGIIELQRRGGWDQARVDAVRGDGAFLAAACSQPQRPKWFTKQGEGLEWRRTAAAGVHLRVSGGRVRLLLSARATRECDVSRDADVTRRRGQWRRCTACYKWRRAVGLTNSNDAVQCVDGCDVPQELSCVQIDEEMGILPWQPMSAEQLQAAHMATEARLAIEAKIAAEAEARAAAEVRMMEQMTAGAGLTRSEDQGSMAAEPSGLAGQPREEPAAALERTGREEEFTTGAGALPVIPGGGPDVPADLGEVHASPRRLATEANAAAAADPGATQASFGWPWEEEEAEAATVAPDEQLLGAGGGSVASSAEIMDVTSSYTEADLDKGLMEGGDPPAESDVEVALADGASGAEAVGASGAEAVGGDGAGAARVEAASWDVVDLTADSDSEADRRRSAPNHARTGTGTEHISLLDSDDDDE